MKKIPLRGKYGKGMYALVDDKDFVEVSQHKWHVKKADHTFYAATNNNGKTLRLHEFILKISIDHKDHNGLNNQRSNLRVATFQENSRNRIIRQKTLSGLKGVTLRKDTGKWCARITDNNYKRIHLGVFLTKNEAARAYNKAAKKYFGKFAILNNI